MARIVLYKSKYGSAKRYAQWIVEALDADYAETGSLSIQELEAYDCIIIGGGIYAGGIKGLSWLKKNYSALSAKDIAVFGVGASPCDETTLAELIARNYDEKLRRLPTFYLRGGWNESSMSWIDRKLCKMLKSSVEKKPEAEREGWEQALMEAIDAGPEASFDWTTKEQLEPLISWAKQNS